MTTFGREAAVPSNLVIKVQADALNQKIAKTLDLPIDCDEVQSVVEQYHHFSERMLSLLHKKDIRIDAESFKKSAKSIVTEVVEREMFEEFGEGLAEHFSKAMNYYTEHSMS